MSNTPQTPQTTIPENLPEIINYNLADPESIAQFAKDTQLYAENQIKKVNLADAEKQMKNDLEEARSEIEAEYEEKSQEELLAIIVELKLLPRRKLLQEKYLSPKPKTNEKPEKSKSDRTKKEPVRKVKKSSGEPKINEKYSKEKCLEEYDNSVCGVRKSGAWWEQCGGELNGEFVCKKCEKTYNKLGHWWRTGHMEVWGEGSLSCDPQFWGHKHGKWSKSKSQEWLVSGDLQDTRDEDFIEEYPIEVAVVEVSDEEDPQEE